MANITILHPGEMGIFVAATARNSGNTVYWVSEGRSLLSRSRAEEFELLEASTLAEIIDISDMILSVCPPHAAEDVAGQVRRCGYRGMYVDANAISPMRARQMAAEMIAAGITFIDGGIVGGPVWRPGQTWLYLSGEHAGAVEPFFTAGPLATEVVSDTIGKASALKMCYAAYTKGTTALLSTILASAEQLGVRRNLETQWERNWEGFVEQTHNRVRRVTAKSWRFEGEMREIAATFESAGLPGGFHQAAAEIYHRTAGFKDEESVPELEQVLDALIHQDDRDGEQIKTG